MAKTLVDQQGEFQEALQNLRHLEPFSRQKVIAVAFPQLVGSQWQTVNLEAVEGKGTISGRVAIAEKRLPLADLLSRDGLGFLVGHNPEPGADDASVTRTVVVDYDDADFNKMHGVGSYMGGKKSLTAVDFESDVDVPTSIPDDQIPMYAALAFGTVILQRLALSSKQA